MSLANDLEREEFQCEEEAKAEDRAATIAKAIAKYTIRIIIFLVCILLAQQLAGCAWNPSPCWWSGDEYNCAVI